MRESMGVDVRVDFGCCDGSTMAAILMLAFAARCGRCLRMIGWHKRDIVITSCNCTRHQISQDVTSATYHP